MLIILIQSLQPMHKEDYEDEKQLICGLLDDDDIPTTSSAKNSSNDRCFAFSAPPILFNLSYRIQEDFFEETPAKIHTNSVFFSPQKSVEMRDNEEINICTSMRKLSLQPGEYSNYEFISVPAPLAPYAKHYTQEQQLLHHLGSICQWARDQYGSRTVQNSLEFGSNFLKEQIFGCIFAECGDLMQDKFGNYVIQKLFESGSDVHKQLMLQEVLKRFLDLSLHCFGCRVVQKAIEFASIREQTSLEIMQFIEPNCMLILTNPNGNHVIQKCLEVIQEAYLQKILGILSTDLFNLAFHAFGCRVIQKYIQCGSDPSRVADMLDKLIDMSLDLSQCQYGNYIIQYIVNNRFECSKRIEKMVSEHFVVLSCNKYASNVIEKVINASSTEFKDRLVQMLIQKGEVKALATHQYGNYVIQSLISKASKDKKTQLAKYLKENCSEISRTQYGRHVLMQLDKAR